MGNVRFRCFIFIKLYSLMTLSLCGGFAKDRAALVVEGKISNPIQRFQKLVSVDFGWQKKKKVKQGFYFLQSFGDLQFKRISSWAEFYFWFPSGLSDSYDVCNWLLSTQRLIVISKFRLPPSSDLSGPTYFLQQLPVKSGLILKCDHFLSTRRGWCAEAVSSRARGRWRWGVYFVWPDQMWPVHDIMSLELCLWWEWGWINCQQTCRRQILEVNWTNSRGEDCTRTGIPRALWVTDVITLMHIKFSCIRCVESKTEKPLFFCCLLT